MTDSILSLYLLEGAHINARAAWLEPADLDVAEQAQQCCALLGLDYYGMVAGVGAARQCTVSRARAVVMESLRCEAERVWLALGTPELDGGDVLMAEYRREHAANLCPDEPPEWLSGSST